LIVDHLVTAWTMVKENKYIIQFPQGPRPAAGAPFPDGTKVFVNARRWINCACLVVVVICWLHHRFREMAMSGITGTRRVNVYKKGLDGNLPQSIDTVQGFEQEYMALQCATKWSGKQPGLLRHTAVGHGGRCGGYTLGMHTAAVRHMLDMHAAAPRYMPDMRTAALRFLLDTCCGTDKYILNMCGVYCWLLSAAHTQAFITVIVKHLHI
jgi:hypothetical protein